VPAIDPDDCYSGTARLEATNVAASRCRQGDGQLDGAAATEAIVKATTADRRMRPRSAASRSLVDYA
jgi:hypothetical protein